MQSNGEPRWVDSRSVRIVRCKGREFLLHRLHRCPTPQADESIIAQSTAKWSLIWCEIVKRELGVGRKARAEHLALEIAIRRQIFDYRGYAHRMRCAKGGRHLGGIRSHGRIDFQ